MIRITLPDNSVREFPGPVTVAEVAASIGAGLAKAAIAGRVDGQLVDTSRVIEHDAQLGDHCHVSTGALVNGGVQLGSGCFIGSGAMLRDRLQLPAGTVISAGKRVMRWPLL